MPTNLFRNTRTFMSAKARISDVFDDGFKGSIEELSERIGVAKSTTRKHLNSLLRKGSELPLAVAGFVPDASLLVDMAEKKIGRIGSPDIMAANLATKEIVDEIAKPELKRVFTDGLPGKRDGEMLSVDVSQLFDYVADDFLPHVTETDNGFVSMVGRLNEEIVLRVLRNSELEDGTDFQRTGQNSVGDIIVSQRFGQRANLYVEVKSYHARERLLRGLQDIMHPQKVGIGFFRDEKEFNKSRTQTLINTGAEAIYLPMDTYGRVSDDALQMTTGKQNFFYRPADMFVEDMISFVRTGSIMEFKAKR